jgi:hypothetical protein
VALVVLGLGMNVMRLQAAGKKISRNNCTHFTRYNIIARVPSKQNFCFQKVSPLLALGENAQQFLFPLKCFGLLDSVCVRQLLNEK